VEFELGTLVDSVLKIYDNKVQNGSMNGLASELKQLISNLVSNAADAVGTN
jgi:signal transduction histidine kinase